MRLRFIPEYEHFGYKWTSIFTAGDGEHHLDWHFVDLT